MMEYKIQPMKDLKAEMLSVARGEQQAPHDAGQITFESIDAVIQFSTPENRQLLTTADEKKSDSVAHPAHKVGQTER